MKKQEQICELPARHQLTTAAGPELKCGSGATVLTGVPVTNRKTGERGMQMMSTCVEHAVDIAVWKFAVRVVEAGRRNPGRIVTL